MFSPFLGKFPIDISRKYCDICRNKNESLMYSVYSNNCLIAEGLSFATAAILRDSKLSEGKDSFIIFEEDF